MYPLLSDSLEYPRYFCRKPFSSSLNRPILSFFQQKYLSLTGTLTQYCRSSFVSPSRPYLPSIRLHLPSWHHFFNCLFILTSLRHLLFPLFFKLFKGMLFYIVHVFTALPNFLDLFKEISLYIRLRIICVQSPPIAGQTHHYYIDVFSFYFNKSKKNQNPIAWNILASYTHVL